MERTAILENAISSFNEAMSDAATDEKRTYTVGEIQEILGISQPTAYALIKAGHFRSIRVGRHIRISKKSFDEWLDNGQN